MARAHANDTALPDPFRADRLPYMPFYVDSWLSSGTVTSFTLEQRAAYLQLLLRQWAAPSGFLPKDEKILAKWSGLGRRWRRLGRPILRKCFTRHRTGYANPRCRELWEHVQAKRDQAKRAAASRWKVHDADA